MFKTRRNVRCFFFFIVVCTFLTFVVSLGTVPGVLSLKNVQKQDGMLAFFGFFPTLFGIDGVKKSLKSDKKATTNQ